MSQKVLSHVSLGTTPKKEGGDSSSSTIQTENDPEIYSMQILSDVNNRFATTLITSKVKNLNSRAKGTTFSIILPENAFISAFEMEIDGNIYKAHVKEKKEAKEVYETAVSRGQSAAHVAVSARDSKTFTISVNLEPQSTAVFRLTYEELLVRQIEQYELVINIHPGQIVEDFAVQVNINESRPLTFVRIPSLRTGNEIKKDDENLDPSAEMKMTDLNSAVIKFKPDIEEQKKFAKFLGSESGIAGQFVVQYDVERDPQGGEVLVRDGYFVHFFAPSDLEALPKHVVFVLDYSGSMEGRKIEQLIDAMENILSELKPEDLFNIVRFSDDASVWDPSGIQFSDVFLDSPKYGHLESQLREAALPKAATVTKQNLEKAKRSLKNQSNMSSTNIIAGLEVGLFLIKRTQEKVSKKHQPIIIFLTDGCPNTGLANVDEIIETVTKLNCGENRTAIFSLSFGEDADKEFLRKLSSQNFGFSRHIYEASDASLQLQDFYKTISSPLLKDINFNYVDEVSDVTRTHHPLLFKGSELVVTGRTSKKSNILLRVLGMCVGGCVSYDAPTIESVGSLERLWAYITVKQMLEEADTSTDNSELTKKALSLSLQYSFVTSVSSLVVVKPGTSNDDDGKTSVKIRYGDYDAEQDDLLDDCEELTGPGTRVDCCSRNALSLLSYYGNCTDICASEYSPCALKYHSGHSRGPRRILGVFRAIGRLPGAIGSITLKALNLKPDPYSDDPKKCILYMKSTNEMTDYVLKEKIQKTFQYRREKGCDPKTFPRFLDRKEMISYEFSLMYPDAKEFIKVFPRYIDKILAYAKKSDNTAVVDVIKDDEEAWPETIRAVLALLYLLLQPNEGSQVEDLLVIFQKAETPIENIFKNSKVEQPFILVVGQNKNYIETFYIVFNQQTIPLSVLSSTESFFSAFDIIFKLHFVFNIKYQERLKSFWHFVEDVFYQNNDRVEVTPQMEKLKKDLCC